MTHVTQSAAHVTLDERAESIKAELEELETAVEVLRSGRLPAEKLANIARLVASRAEVLARLYEDVTPRSDLHPAGSARHEKGNER